MHILYKNILLRVLERKLTSPLQFSLETLKRSEYQMKYLHSLIMVTAMTCDVPLLCCSVFIGPLDVIF